MSINVEMIGQTLTTLTAKAASNGTLLLMVPLGPSNAFQEYTPEANALGTLVYTTSVTITKEGK